MRAALLALALAVAAPLDAAPPAVEVELSPASATAGDLVSATLRLRLADAAAAERARFPDWSRGWGEVEVRESGAVESSPLAGGGVELSQHLTLAAFRVGELPLPPVAVELPVSAGGAARTPAGVVLEIRSVLPEDRDDLAPQPPAPPVRLEVPRAFAWTAGTLAAAALAGAWWSRRRAPAAASAAAPRLAPLAELELELEALAGAEAAAGHARLSLALRRFLGRSFSMPAAESTTSELARRLATRGLDPTLVRRTVALLRGVDEVKFARRPTSRDELGRRSAEAGALGAAVDQHLHPPAASEAAA